MLNFSNTNTVWASIMAETLSRLGLKTAVICPGSRSAPLAIAFAQHPQIEAIPVLDERSAAFFALGLARRSGVPVALVCSSGTAGANFYPAVIEAHESRVPLLILTGDRPPELRDCNAGQTIDQQKLYGHFPTWYHELATPSLDPALLAYLRQTTRHAWDRSLTPVAGPVHLNCPFRDPLAPVPQAEAQALSTQLDETAFFAGIAAQTAPPSTVAAPRLLQATDWPWPATERGIILAGPAQPRSPRAYCEAIALLAKTLGFPVLAEGLSPLRNAASLNPWLVSTYDLIVRHPAWAEQLAPEVVIHIGETPTSKELRAWLQRTQPHQWVIDAGDRNLDPLHLRTTHLRLSVEQVMEQVAAQVPAAPTPYLQHWLATEAQMGQHIDAIMQQTDGWIEGKVAWLLSRCLPPGTPLFIANSLSVRHVEWFWRPGDRQIQPFFNRGANGIDGTLSTALGMAHRHQPGVLLTGDLALLHDTNGFLLRSAFMGHLTIVVVNNQGGGIFETLPIAQFDPPFEQFFATPQSVEFAPLCATYGVDHKLVHTWEQLAEWVSTLPGTGLRVLEVVCDRKTNIRWLHENLTPGAIE